MVLLASADAATDLQKLAEMADKVMEVAAPNVAAVSVADSSSEVKQLREEVARLADLVATLNRGHSRDSRSRSRGRRPHSPAAQNDHPQDQTLCWYHKKFGESAKKCQDPCAWGNA